METALWVIAAILGLPIIFWVLVLGASAIYLGVMTTLYKTKQLYKHRGK